MNSVICFERAALLAVGVKSMDCSFTWGGHPGCRPPAPAGTSRCSIFCGRSQPLSLPWGGHPGCRPPAPAGTSRCSIFCGRSQPLSLPWGGHPGCPPPAPAGTSRYSIFCSRSQPLSSRRLGEALAEGGEAALVVVTAEGEALQVRLVLERGVEIHAHPAAQGELGELVGALRAGRDAVGQPERHLRHLGRRHHLGEEAQREPLLRRHAPPREE